MTKLETLDISNNQVEDLCAILPLMKKGTPVVWDKIRPDFAWDSQAAFRALCSELTAFAKGKKTIRELFVEE